MTRKTLGALLFLLLGTRAVQAADCMSLAGRWPYGPPRAAALAGDLYLLGSGSAFQVTRVSGSNLTVQAELIVPGLIDSIVAAGNLAYVATQNGGLHIVDISNPLQPAQVSATELTPGGFGSLAITGDKLALSGGYLYISPLRDPEVRVLDVRDPTQPKLVSTFPLGARVGEIAVSGHLLLVGTWEGLEILDASNPSQLRRLTKWGAQGVASVTPVGSLAYLSSPQDPGLVILDISRPDNPAVIATLPTPTWDVLVQGSTAFVADWFGLRILNVANPASPVELRYLSFSIGDIPVRVLGGTSQQLFVSFGDGLDYSQTVYDVANPSNPIVLALYSGSGPVGRAVASPSSSLLYLANDIGGLRILDISDPKKPRELGFVDTPGSALDVAVEGSFAYVADGLGVRVVDVSDPHRPFEVGSLAFETHSRQAVNGIVVAGSRAFVSILGSGVVILDISVSTQPRQIGVLTSKDAAFVRRDGNLLVYQIYQEALHIVDISRPEAPREVSSLPGVFTTFQAAGSLVYVTSPGDTTYASSVLRIFDLSDPTHPAERGSLSLFGYFETLAIAGDRLYCLGYDVTQDLQVIDVSDPSHPALVAWHNTFKFPNSITLVGRYLFVSAGEYGLDVLDVGTCSACGLKPDELCLRDGRFAAEVTWKDFQGRTGVGMPVRLTSDTGYFWFFDDANVELVLKVLDGTAATGHFWTFYGSLTNVQFDLKITDRVTGNSKTYSNPAGSFASVGDTAALPAASLAPPRVAAKALTAEFRWEPEHPRPGETVVFTDQSAGGPENWCWRFGDEPAGSQGCSATVSSPQHSYAEVGVYTVYLRTEASLGSPAPEIAEVRKTLTVASSGCSYQLSRNSASFTAVGGTGRFQVDTQAGCSWEASSDSPWIRLGATATGIGPGEVSFTVQSNPGAARSGAVTVKDQTLRITQDAASPPPRPHCQPSSKVLCLRDERFAISADWKDFQNRTGKGQAVSLTADTGYFWFFAETNVEVALKVIDGRGVNGYFWVYYGALSNVEFSLTVTDTLTGAVQIYRNPAGRFASHGDVTALPGQ